MIGGVGVSIYPFCVTGAGSCPMSRQKPASQPVDERVGAYSHYLLTVSGERREREPKKEEQNRFLSMVC